MRLRSALGDRPVWPPLVLESVLGHGRHGRVYRATCRASEPPRSIAVKVPTTPDVGEHELAALRRLEHESVVAVHGEASGALLLELAERGTLQDQLDRRTCLSPSEVAGVVAAVVDALAHVHAQGWIHGDVNPTNIGVRNDGSVMLFDFATAGPIGSTEILEATPAFVGSDRRARPELDLRATAATALACLGPEEARLRSRLAGFIGGIDDTLAGTGAELLAVFAAVPTVPIRPGPSGGGPGRGRTAGFGPRPEPADDPTSEENRSRARALALVGACTLVVGVVFSAVRSPDADAGGGERGGVVGSAVGAVITAEASLAAHDVSWDVASATIVEPDGSRWRVGEVGDRVAVGDWDCDGVPTLGVYRPATGEWFVFRSWVPMQESAAPTVLPRGSELHVRRLAPGCDEPVPVA